MGQLERLKEEEAGRKKAKQKAPRVNGATSRFVAYHPTKEEREDIRKMEEDLGEIMDFLFTFLEDGHTLHFGVRLENSASYVMLRQGDVHWQDAVTLSCWHLNYETAARTLAYGLRGKYSTFPDIQLALFHQEVDW